MGTFAGQVSSSTCSIFTPTNVPHESDTIKHYTFSNELNCGAYFKISQRPLRSSFPTEPLMHALRELNLHNKRCGMEMIMMFDHAILHH